MMVWMVIVASVLLGAGASFLVRTESNAFKYLLAFSGAFLFGMLLTHLIPEVFAMGESHAGWWILAGFGLQLALDYLSKGIEHGHYHAHGKVWPVLPLIGLLIHSFTEGLPLSSGVEHPGHTHVPNEGLLWSVALHKLPIALLITTALRKAEVPKVWVIVAVGVLAVSTPLGHEWGQVLMLNPTWEMAVLGVTSGLLLHVSTTILFESSANHQFNAIKLLFVALGIGLSLFF